MIPTGSGRLGPVRWSLTSRLGGVSRPPWDSLNLAAHVGDAQRAVAENRRRAATAAGAGDLAVIQAEHGGRVRRVSAGGEAPPGDAIVTTTPGVGLLALGADCVTAVLAAPDVPAVAVLHCGWRGILADVAGATVEAMVELGAAPGELQVQLGPAICPQCYEVSGDVRRRVSEQVGAASAVTRTGAPALDLVGAVAAQLAAQGVDRIGRDGRCTFEAADLYSYRRDGTTGRHGLLAVLGEDDDTARR